jgi:hypothetical protein
LPVLQDGFVVVVALVPPPGFFGATQQIVPDSENTYSPFYYV